MRSLLKTTALSKWFGEIVAVNNLELDIGTGVTGLLGPNGAGKSTFMKLALGLYAPSRGTIAGFTRAFDPLQSGFVVPVATLDAVGMFDEGLFIDGVDSEFTARVRAAGLEVLVGTGCQLEHALGKREPAVLFGRPLRLMGRPITYNYHSPSRVYYISRNGATLAARYLRTDPVWVARRSVEELKAHTLRIGLGRDKAKLLLAAVSGIGDAFRHRTGRLTDDMARKFSGQQSSS